MDVRRVLIFREVARSGSIAGAARSLGWTQPAVSQHLAALERQAGVPLVVRGPGGTTITEAGAALVRRADAIAAELHAAGEELGDLAGLRSGRVRLQSFPSAAATLVPDAVRSLADSHAGVSVGLVEAEPPDAVPAVAAGDADLALVFGYDGAPADLEGRAGLVWRPLLTEAVRLVTPPGLPVPSSVSELARSDWIGGCERCRGHLVQVCRRAGFEPALRHTTDDYVVVQNLVARGLGVAVLPDSALAAYRHPAVQVDDLAELGVRHVGVVHRTGADVVPATRALIAELEGAVAVYESGQGD
ncbi:LysR family transcriptional regulator [Nocardioides acrostichi]|uniref:LysR family transcriptional regulator n=1 Tax=Nocardioides acrostichi TaxID=2784339 RepID=A0A930Y6U0_9ACTN|nr:LysR family transcriptional regulator [Nocardioides acrostichi]MBF4161301.1 LysR family transcriptional regulator [Nocardioides acrostichi]